jgi:hypothetical protein
MAFVQIKCVEMTLDKMTLFTWHLPNDIHRNDNFFKTFDTVAIVKMTLAQITSL